MRLMALGAALVLLSGCERKVPEPAESSPPAARSSAEAPVLQLAPSPVGEWVESQRYRLRVLDLRPCDQEKTGPFRLGVTVEIQANPGKDVSPVFASPRAAELEKNGKVFHPAVDPALTPTCTAPLEPRRLGPGESVRGTLVFEAPDISYFRSSVLGFRPPRWGRDGRVTVQLPDCFDDGCREPARATASPRL